MKAKMLLPNSVIWMYNIFRTNNYPLYVVGGAVRDFVIHGNGYNYKDIDLATSAVPDEVERILSEWLPPSSSIKTVGKAFGVVLVTVGGKDYEIATFRQDAKTGDGRRPDYVTFSTMEEDAARRDLTINALYYDIGNEEIIDFHGGLDDLRKGSIRFVGNPIERLVEDKLRALRFVRFHCRVSEGDNLDPEGALAIRNLGSLRPEISDERIRDEFIKGLNSALNRVSFLRILDNLGLLTQIFPDLEIDRDIRGKGTSLTLLLGRLLINNSPDLVRNRLLSLKYTVKEAEGVNFLLKLSKYISEDQVVTFKKDFKKSGLTVGEVNDFCTSPLINDMLLSPYPTIRGEELMADGYQGIELGRKMVEVEIKNFKEWRCKGGS